VLVVLALSLLVSYWIILISRPIGRKINWSENNQCTSTSDKTPGSGSIAVGTTTNRFEENTALSGVKRMCTAEGTAQSVHVCL